MTIDQVQLYKQMYTGNKVTFNSRKHAGVKIKGIAIQIVPQEGLIILRDKEQFPHAVSILTLQQV